MAFFYRSGDDETTSHTPSKSNARERTQPLGTQLSGAVLTVGEPAGRQVCHAWERKGYPGRVLALPGLPKGAVPPVGDACDTAGGVGGGSGRRWLGRGFLLTLSERGR